MTVVLIEIHQVSCFSEKIVFLPENLYFANAVPIGCGLPAGSYDGCSCLKLLYLTMYSTVVSAKPRAVDCGSNGVEWALDFSDLKDLNVPIYLAEHTKFIG